MSKYKLLRYNTNKGCYFKIKRRFNFLWFIPTWKVCNFIDYYGDDCFDMSEQYSRIETIEEAQVKLNLLKKLDKEIKEHIISIDEL